MRKSVAFAAIVVCALAADASAQVVQRPARPYRGLFGGGPRPDPNRSRTEVTFAGSLLMGYDTWLSPNGGGDPASQTDARQSGTAVTGEGSVNFFRGKALRSIAFTGLARTNAYSGINAAATIGGSATVNAETTLGRKMQLRAAQDFAYDPTLVLDVPADPAGLDPVTPPVPIADVSSGYLEQRSYSLSSMVNLDQRWSARQITLLGAGYSRATYLDSLGHDTTALSGNITHTWSFTRTASVRGLYHVSDADLSAVGGLSTPMTTQNFGVSFGYNRRLSPTRQLQLNVGGGTINVKTLHAEDRSTLEYWTPSGNGSISWDIGRSWSVGGEYSRSATVLQGVSLTSFATDAGSASVSGLINQRLEASLSTTYSNGRSGGAETSGRFQNYSGSLQLLVALSRCCATAINYDYFVYKFEDLADLPSALPPSFDRQAIRVGLTISLPLYGTYTDGGRLRGARRN